MPDFVEYKYDPDHLTEKEALERYKLEKARHPNSIVTLDKLECGHWTVKVYSSVSEKESALRRKLDDYIGNVWPHY